MLIVNDTHSKCNINQRATAFRWVLLYYDTGYGEISSLLLQLIILHDKPGNR